MNVKQYIYADGVANVSLMGGMVRLDLFHYAGNPDAGNHELDREVDTQLVLSPAAFMRAFAAMQRFVDELEKKGVVSRAPERKPEPQQSVSPNFA